MAPPSGGRAFWALALLAACAQNVPQETAGTSRRRTVERHGRAGGGNRGGRGATPARVVRITSGTDCLGGPGASGQLGDYRMDNGRVAFVIDALGRSAGFALSGGNVIDAGVLPAGRDALGHFFTYFGEFPRQAIYDRLTVVDAPDGSAVIQVEGRDSKDQALRVTTRYRLARRVDFLEIDTTIENRGATEVELSLGDAIHWGGLQHFAPGQGFRLSDDMSVPWIAGVGASVSVGYGAFSAPVRGRSGSSWTDTVLAVARIGPGQATSYQRVLAVASTPDTARVAARIHTLRGERLGAVRGRTVDPRGMPVAGARVELWDVTGTTMQDLGASDQHGRFLLRTPAGHYRLSARAAGRSNLSGTDLVIVAGEEPYRTLQMSEQSFLLFRLHEPSRQKNGGLVSGKLTIEGLGDTATPDFGPIFRTLAANVLYSVTGHGSVPLAPGRYRVTASRGPEYALSVHEVEIPSHGEVAIDAQLERVIDTRGYLCGDFHQHTVGSADAATTVRDRMISNAGEGLEIVVASDHNYVNDFTAAINNLGLEDEIFSIAGNEVTTDTSPRPIGHFNVYPVARQEGAVDGGAWNVYGRSAAEIFALAGVDGVDRVIQINHPRSHDNGYMALTGYDPLTNRGRPGEYSGGFDAIEVFNGGRIDAVPAVLTDVYAMWNRGLTPTLTGSSDTHAIVTEEPGFPRTCLALGDDVSGLTDQAVVDAIKRERNVIVTNGPFVRMRIGDAPIGSLVQAPPGRIDLDVEVQAAPWVDVTTLQVVVNGEPDDPVLLPPPADASTVVRYRGTLHPRLWRDSWLQVIVRGERPLHPVVQHDPPDGPLALTNPIWVDVDGNGRFDPPIVGAMSAPAAARPSRRGPGAAPPLPRVNPADRSAPPLPRVNPADR